MSDRTNGSEFPQHFDGRRLYNAQQTRGLVDVIQSTLTSRPELSPSFLADDMDTDQAVRAHEILAARTSIAVHHGTLQLADEGIDKPRKQLLAIAPQDSFLVLNNGQFAELP